MSKKGVDSKQKVLNGRKRGMNGRYPILKKENAIGKQFYIGRIIR